MAHWKVLIYSAVGQVPGSDPDRARGFCRAYSNSILCQDGTLLRILDRLAEFSDHLIRQI